MRKEGSESREAEALLYTVNQLAQELHPGGKLRALPSLDSSLTKDLGLDSLSRVELLSRIEREFGLHLPDRVLVEAETPGDLLEAMRRTGDISVPAKPPALPPLVAAAIPEESKTLLEVLDWHVETHPERPHIRLLEEQGLVEITYRQLFEGALAVSNGLRARGIQVGQTVGLMLPTEKNFFYAFMGVMMAGGIPVPLYPPFRKVDLQDQVLRQAGILNNCLASFLITTSEAKKIFSLLRPLVETLDQAFTVAELTGPPSGRLVVQAEDTAFLQYTSGSTGQPKGVVLSHLNLLANIRALGQAAEVSSTDVFVSWMPLYHDLGLVGAWLASLYFGMLAVIFSPLTFLGRPERWLWAISEHKGTISAAPNFAYELCARRLRDEELEGLNLSSLRLAVCGAELIRPATTERFTERFGPYGFKPEAFTPAYGLAEATVGLTLTPPRRGPRIDRIERAPFQNDNRAVPAAPDDPNSVRIVSCGKPLPGFRIRITDPKGRDLPERTVGRLEFSGPSSTCGYYRNPEATRGLFDEGWLDSGDLAYLAEGEVYLTGRTKDLIIRGGQHFFPDELEERIGDLPEITPGGVVVFGVDDPVSGTERIVVFAETTERDRLKLEKLRKNIGEKSLEVLGNPAKILFGPPQSLPKTASGKIRRSTSRALYLEGKLGTLKPAWRQLGQLLFESIAPRIRRVLRRVGEVLYAGYAWFCFGLTAPLVWLFITLLPSVDRRRRLLRASAGLIIRVLGLSPEVQGLEKLKSCPCVLVANHQSFFDSLLLAALLPPDTLYTPGREFNRFWLSKVFLERLGVQFVERLDPRGGAKDIERLSGEIERGRTVMVFPEGAIYPEPGLRPFRMGAFLAAARAGVPVLPMGIRGSRAVLPPKSWFPHRGKVNVIVGDPIMPEGSTWSAAVRLHGQAFEAVKRLCRERPIQS